MGTAALRLLQINLSYKLFYISCGFYSQVWRFCVFPNCRAVRSQQVALFTTNQSRLICILSLWLLYSSSGRWKNTENWREELGFPLSILLTLFCSLPSFLPSYLPSYLLLLCRCASGCFSLLPLPWILPYNDGVNAPLCCRPLALCLVTIRWEEVLLAAGNTHTHTL